MNVDKLKGHIPDRVLNELPSIIEKYGFNTLDRITIFLAQIGHESGNFTIKTENMNYSTPARLVEIWPSRFTIKGEVGKLNANLYIKDAKKLANTVYAGRMGNGDFASGDGYLYRGGGYLQLTGKESYTAYAKYINKDIQETSELVHTTEHYALDSAAWEFVVNKKLLDECDRGEFITITKRINGGTIGLEDRKAHYTKFKQLLD
jgi:putative chitinase